MLSNVFLPPAISNNYIQVIHMFHFFNFFNTFYDSAMYPSHHGSLPILLSYRQILNSWARSLNEELKDERWSVDFFKKSLSQFSPELLNQCAIEKLILLLHGLSLRKIQDGNKLDFEYSLNFLKKGLNLLEEIFPENGNMAAIHIKNMFNETSPGFFKNLIFRGGPNINPGIVSIKSKYSLNCHIDSFNKNLSELGITVEYSDIIQECKVTFQKFNEKEKIDYKWLIALMDTN